MDPDAALKELRELFALGKWGVEEVERVIILWTALDRWMSTGGFPPKEWRAK